MLRHRFPPRASPDARKPHARGPWEYSGRLLALPPLLLVAALHAACATGSGGRPSSGDGAAPIEGWKALYEGRSGTPEEKHRFRLALALAAGRMRIEILPPVGGPRLVVTSDGTRLLALDPAHRRAEVWEAHADGVARLIGASIGVTELRRLLEAGSPCAGAAEAPQSDGGCAFGSGRYRPGPDAGSATLDDASGRPLLHLEYPPGRSGRGEGGWRPAIVLKRPGDASSIHLTLVSGPARAALDPGLFSTERPDRFEAGEVLGDEGLSRVVAGERGDSP